MDHGRGRGSSAPLAAWIGVAVAAVVAGLVPASLVVLGFAVLAVGIGNGGIPARRPSTRWGAGWWLVALAAPPIGLAGAVLAGAIPAAVETVGLGAGGIGAWLLVVGRTRTMPLDDGVTRRPGRHEGVLGALVVTYLVAGTLPVEHRLVGLAGAAVTVGFLAAAWVGLLHQRAAAERVTPADRWFLGAATALLGAGVLAWPAALLDAGWVPAVQRAVAALVAAALVLFLRMLATPEAGQPLPIQRLIERTLSPGHVGLIVAAVLAAPLVLAIRLLAGWTEDLAATALAGALLAGLAVVHVVLLVRDHGARVWRARHDPLTGLPTEPLFRDRVEQAIARARRGGGGLAVGFVDLDGFKQVNDRDSHEAGDVVLRTVARRLQAALREQDTVARRSGDEFLVLLPEVNRPGDAEVVAGKLLGAARAPVQVGERVHRVGASIGLALWPRDGRDVDELIRHADAAMYDVKDARGDDLRWYTRVTTTRTRLRLTLAQQLERALGDPEQLVVAYQPQVDLRDGRLEGLVALVRWRHPQLGLITPRSFLPLATEAGLIPELDQAVLARATEDVARWHEAGWLDVPVTVHVGDAHVGRRRLPSDVAQQLRVSRLPASQLVLAVSAAGIARAGAQVVANAHELAELGIALTASRFGASALDLDRLSRMPLSAVELASQHAGTLSQGLTRVVAAGFAIADRFGFTVTANGVRDETQTAVLREHGCRVARGPHLAPPLLHADLDERLRTRGPVAGGDGTPVPVATIVEGALSDDPEPPGLAAVLAAAAGIRAQVDERLLMEVLEELDQPVDAGGHPAWATGAAVVVGGAAGAGDGDASERRTP